MPITVLLLAVITLALLNVGLLVVACGQHAGLVESDRVVLAQADIIEHQAGELKDLRDCFDGMTDLCMASLSAIR